MEEDFSESAQWYAVTFVENGLTAQRLLLGIVSGVAVGVMYAENYAARRNIKFSHEWQAEPDRRYGECDYWFRIADKSQYEGAMFNIQPIPLNRPFELPV